MSKIITLQKPEPCCERCVHDSGKYKVPYKRMTEHLKTGDLRRFDFCMNVHGQIINRKHFFWDGSTK